MRREETVDHHIKAAWHSIARMYNQQAALYDATMAMGYVLLVINAEEGTPATKIAPLMGLEPRSLTRLLNTMEERGVIARKNDLTDKRSIRVMLTAKGKQMREKAKETVLQFNQMVRHEIEPEKLDVFFEVITKIQQVVEREPVHEN
ncbi:MAG: MarR family transcriptional regulator [Cyclobacteriaceae bacterium]|jgi:DNA-binding MarR family transcriptional regulator|nr:MarR family transcriptional regulator [Flammeovirgaceae bacterium]MCZ8020817.1 MarR family transcriptional regulator [Cytophagales bacterium]MCZ8328433.1 MarR family transcriptional regulator [Cyclobacteriaceae bacterium]